MIMDITHLLLIDISGKTILIIMLIFSVLITLYGCLPLTQDDIIEEKRYDVDEEIKKKYHYLRKFSIRYR